MSDYVKQTKAELKSQSRGAVSTAQDAVASQAWLYPLKGIVYFLSHRACWGPFLKALPSALLLSAGVLGSAWRMMAELLDDDADACHLTYVDSCSE